MVGGCTDVVPGPSDTVVFPEFECRWFEAGLVAAVGESCVSVPGLELAGGCADLPFPSDAELFPDVECRWFEGGWRAAVGDVCAAPGTELIGGCTDTSRPSGEQLSGCTTEEGSSSSWCAWLSTFAAGAANELSIADSNFLTGLPDLRDLDDEKELSRNVPSGGRVGTTVERGPPISCELDIVDDCPALLFSLVFLSLFLPSSVILSPLLVGQSPRLRRCITRTKPSSV